MSPTVNICRHASATIGPLDTLFGIILLVMLCYIVIVSSCCSFNLLNKLFFVHSISHTITSGIWSTYYFGNNQSSIINKTHTCIAGDVSSNSMP